MGISVWTVQKWSSIQCALRFSVFFHPQCTFRALFSSSTSCTELLSFYWVRDTDGTLVKVAVVDGSAQCFFICSSASFINMRVCRMIFPILFHYTKAVGMIIENAQTPVVAIPQPRSLLLKITTSSRSSEIFQDFCSTILPPS